MRAIIKSVLTRLRGSSIGTASLIGQSRSAPEIFGKIYGSNYWGSSDSRSGTGSDLLQTAEVRSHLPALLKEYDIRSMLDIPCGDWHWMKEAKLDVDYIGADIVPELVRRNQARYGNDRCRFVLLDMTRDVLPAVDLVFSRDVLVHLSFADAVLAIQNIKRSGSKYFLTTTFPARDTNIEIPTGHWRPLNLEIAPFWLPPPAVLINEKCTEGDGSWGDKSLGLWRLPDLPC